MSQNGRACAPFLASSGIVAMEYQCYAEWPARELLQDSENAAGDGCLLVYWDRSAMKSASKEFNVVILKGGAPIDVQPVMASISSWYATNEHGRIVRRYGVDTTIPGRISPPFEVQVMDLSTDAIAKFNISEGGVVTPQVATTQPS